MKVAIPSTGEGLSASVEQRFGRCPTFLVVNTETMDWKAVPNKAADQPGGAGVAAAQTVVDEGAEVVLAGDIGPNASDILSGADIRVFGRISGTVKEALEMLQSGALERTSENTAVAQEASGADRAAEMGQRRGGGRGMRMGQGHGAGTGRGGGRARGRGRGRGRRRGDR